MESWVASRLIASVDGIAVDNNGRLYLSCDGFFWGKQDNGGIKGLYRGITDITGIVYDGNHSIYMCNIASQGTIEKYDVETKQITIVFDQNPPLRNPRAIAMDKNGDIYVAEDYYVYRINPSTKSIQPIEKKEEEDTYPIKFNFPTGMVVSNEGTIFVLDHKNACLGKIVDGKTTTLQVRIDPPRNDTGRVYPRGILLEDENHLLIVSQNALLRINVIEEVATTVIPLKYGSALTRDSKGNLYVGTNYGILMLKPLWTTGRLLWIGHMKEDAMYCDLAKLPREIIALIASYVSWVVPPIPEKPPQPTPAPQPPKETETPPKEEPKEEPKKEDTVQPKVEPEEQKQSEESTPVPRPEHLAKPTQHKKCIVQ